MTQPPTAGTNHEAYVRAVIAELAERDVEVSDIQLTAAPDRLATMKISPPGSDDDVRDTTWDGAEWITLRWTPATGWVWQVKYGSDASPRAAIYFGFSAVPRPTDVADWLHIGLSHPMVTPSREDNLPFATPDLDEVLRAYAVTTG